jgi:hypothetical protein
MREFIIHNLNASNCDSNIAISNTLSIIKYITNLECERINRGVVVKNVIPIPWISTNRKALG